MHCFSDCFPMFSIDSNGYMAFWVAIERASPGSPIVNWVLPNAAMNRLVPLGMSGSGNWYSNDYPNGAGFMSYDCGVMTHRTINNGVLMPAMETFDGRFWMEPCTEKFPSICQLPNAGPADCTTPVQP